MSIKPSWRFFQLVLLIGCGYVFRFSDCLVLNAINGHTFSLNASAEFECIIDPYTNSQTWFVDSVSVADCGIIVCSENASNPERYSFRPNTSDGHFIFKIKSISLEDNDNVIRCFDGTTFKETSISVTETVTTATTSKTVDDNGGGGGGDGGGGGIASEFWIIIVLFVIFISIIIAGIAVYKKSHPRACSSHITSFKTTRTLRPANAEVTSAPQYEAHLEQPMHAEQSVDIKAKIEVWMNEPGNCCIIMKGLLRIGELSEKIVKQTKIMFSSPLQAQPDNFRLPNIHHNRAQPDNPRLPNNHHNRAQPHNSRLRHIYHIRDVNQLYEENEIDQMRESIRREQQEGACDVHIKKGLVESATISSFVMRGFSEEFFDYMILRLQQNTDIYQKIEADIQKNEIANDDQMRIEH